MATNYANDANCVGYFAMRDSTTETDRGGNTSNDLTVSSGDTIPTSIDVPSGYSGTSRDFEAADADYLSHAGDLETNVNGADAKLSLCCFVKFESLVGVAQSVIAKYASASGQRQYYLGTYTDNALNFYLSKAYNDMSGADILTSASAFSTGTWYHICGVYNDIDMRIYKDGSLSDTPLAKTDGISSSTALFTIGNRIDYSDAVDGLIMDAAVFNRDLSSVEVSDIYTNGVDGTKGSGVAGGATGFMTTNSKFWGM